MVVNQTYREPYQVFREPSLLSDVRGYAGVRHEARQTDGRMHASCENKRHPLNTLRLGLGSEPASFGATSRSQALNRKRVWGRVYGTKRAETPKKLVQTQPAFAINVRH